MIIKLKIIKRKIEYENCRRVRRVEIPLKNLSKMNQ